MYLRLPLLLTLSLSPDIVASGSDKQQNDTSKEAVLDETGNVEMVDPRITMIESKIKEAIRDGRMGPPLTIVRQIGTVVSNSIMQVI